MQNTRIAFLALSLALPAAAQDWSNLGGNARRNGRTPVVGPHAAQPAWSNTDDPTLISWFPAVHEGRVFTVRESGFPQDGGAANDALVVYDLATGVEEWRLTLPFGGDTSKEWIAWVAGAHGGRVYASRASHQKPAPMLAYDAATGAPLWTSTWAGQTFAYDGVVFAPDGDLVVGDFQTISRIEATDGTTVWSTTRSCPVSGNCGVALSGDAVYFDEPVPGGNAIGKLDLASGAYLYSSPVMSGFTAQNAPFLGPDGTVFFARSQNNPGTDYLYAFDDDGTQMTQRWRTAVRWTTGHEHGVAADGSVYTFNPAEEFVRLDPATGAETANAGVLAPLGGPDATPHTVVDGEGKVYVGNGWASSPASSGRVWGFDADLTTTLFTLSFQRPNIGGPVLGAGGLTGAGTLVVADLQGVHAFSDGSIGVHYCSPAELNSTGLPARIDAGGSHVVADDALVLAADQLPPNKLGYFLRSTSQADIPVDAGRLCLGARAYRYRKFLQDSGPNGEVNFQPDLDQPPSGPPVAAGETWNFQYWFRDGQQSNFSDAVAVTFR